MSFTSYIFIAFLAALVLLYYIVPKRCQWVLLLVSSYVFYAFAGWKCLIYILTTTVVTYYSALRIGDLFSEQSAYLKANKAGMTSDEKRAYKQGMEKRRSGWLAGGLVALFGMLVVIKYTNFAVMSINSIGGWFGREQLLALPDLVLPLGISFYVFQSAGYIIDVWRKKHEPQRDFFRLALFVSFFPQLIQGPISRYEQLSETLYAEHDFSARRVSFGLQRVLWGYFKKLVVADRLLPAVKTLISVDGDKAYDGMYVFLLMMFYAVQLYADFTGGIDITIGAAQMLGVDVEENFIRPYFSKDIEEYWRRWHITMGTWFRDYVFYPLSASDWMMNVSKKSRKAFGNNIGKRIPVYIATLLTWLVTGLWHAQYTYWNFIVWGVLNGVIIIISQELKPLYGKFHTRCAFSNTRAWEGFAVLRTFMMMSALRLFDCYRDVGLTFRKFGTLFTRFNWGELADGAMSSLGITTADYIVVGCGVALMLAVSLAQRHGSVRKRIASHGMWAQAAVCLALFFAILVFGAYGQGYDASQFIYNQF